MFAGPRDRLHPNGAPDGTDTAACATPSRARNSLYLSSTIERYHAISIDQTLLRPTVSFLLYPLSKPPTQTRVDNLHTYVYQFSLLRFIFLATMLFSHFSIQRLT